MDFLNSAPVFTTAGETMGDAGGVSIDANVLYKRLKALYERWQVCTHSSIDGVGVEHRAPPLLSA